jgi:hypothetical protein
MGSPTHYACCGKKMLSWICEKMATQELAPGGGRFSTSDLTVIRNSPSKFPHTMWHVKRVKHNMQLAFIEKLFTNHEIGTSVQTRYLHFKGMLYKSKSYLYDISCVQLRKVLAWFWCGNLQFEVMLSAWKGVPYAKRLCQGCDLRKVEDEKNLFLVCPSTQKVKECFCSTLPLTHISTVAELMQTTNTVALAKFVAYC